jgi:hypothetical protein
MLNSSLLEGLSPHLIPQNLRQKSYTRDCTGKDEATPRLYFIQCNINWNKPPDHCWTLRRQLNHQSMQRHCVGFAWGGKTGGDYGDDYVLKLFFDRPLVQVGVGQPFPHGIQRRLGAVGQV